MGAEIPRERRPVKRLTLTRRWYEADRTIGELHCEGEFVAFTMEPGGADTDAPRVPVGFYHLERHDAPGLKFKDTWALCGSVVSHEPREGMRVAVLFHAGNYDEQTLGCILLGERIGRLKDETALLDSLDAMARLRGILGTGEGYLTIRGG